MLSRMSVVIQETGTRLVKDVITGVTVPPLYSVSAADGESFLEGSKGGKQLASRESVPKLIGGITKNGPRFSTSLG